jgi:MFS transporter, FHS family, glucose/mannose:H+ symporter
LSSLIRTHAALLIAGILSFTIMGAGQSLYGPALPAFAREFGLTVAQAGWLDFGAVDRVGGGGGGDVLARPAGDAAPCAGGDGRGVGIIASGIGWWPTLAGS